MIFRRYGLLDPINFAFIMYVCLLCTYTLTSPQLIIFRLIYRSGAKCRYPDSPHYTHIWDMMLLLMGEIVLHDGSRIVSKWLASSEAIPARIRVRDNDLFYLFAIHRRVFDGVSICDSSRGGLVVIVKMVVE